MNYPTAHVNSSVQIFLLFLKKKNKSEKEKCWEPLEVTLVVIESASFESWEFFPRFSLPITNYLSSQSYF